MPRKYRCRKCHTLLSSINNKSSSYGDHGWKFLCCGIEYYTCNQDTCRSNYSSNYTCYYKDPKHLDNHIQKYHMNEKEVSSPDLTDDDDRSICPVMLEDLINTSSLKASYIESSSLCTYYTENCSQDQVFSFQHQRDAIKKIITMACAKKRGVWSLSKSICNSSFAIFFAIAQIAFLANDLVLNYLSVILSLVMPLWKSYYNCQLDIPITPEQIKNTITSTANFSIRSLIPMPTMEQVSDHSYSSLPSLLAYTAMTSHDNSQASKPRYIAWMNSPFCSHFLDTVKTISQTTEKTSVAVFMVFWSDGFDPTQSSKRNRHSLWILTVTFFL